MPNSILVTVDAIARRLGRSDRAVRRLVAAGKLPRPLARVHGTGALLWDRRAAFRAIDAVLSGEGAGVEGGRQLNKIEVSDPDLKHFKRPWTREDQYPGWRIAVNRLAEDYGAKHGLTLKGIFRYVNRRFIQVYGVNVLRGLDLEPKAHPAEVIEYWGLGEVYLRLARDVLKPGVANVIKRFFGG